MGRYIGPKCRLCRREEVKLFLKGERCFLEKCSVSRRKNLPGKVQGFRVKLSEYGLQLREKQKLKRMYGLTEKQFRKFYAEAARQKGKPGENLLKRLESRLDNLVYRLGFASSRTKARQMVRHNFIKVNEKRVNLPAYINKQGDIIELVPKGKELKEVKRTMGIIKQRGVAPYLDLNADKFSGKFLYSPPRNEIATDINEQLIVELYSK